MQESNMQCQNCGRVVPRIRAVNIGGGGQITPCFSCGEEDVTWVPTDAPVNRRPEGARKREKSPSRTRTSAVDSQDLSMVPWVVLATVMVIIVILGVL